LPLRSDRNSPSTQMKELRSLMTNEIEHVFSIF